MTTRLFALALLLASLLLPPLPATAAETDSRVFELRTYHAAPGKLDALHSRFRDHTVKLFEKHGIDSIAYWVPLENEANILTYIVAYPSREAREASWKAFAADPAWQAAKAASEADGKLVEKVDSTFMTMTDFSPPFPEASSKIPPVTEMRTYTTNPGKLHTLHTRFRDHTIALFEKHGITNLPYFQRMEDQENAENTLVYFLAHDSVEARDASFKAFGQDPEWQSARDASEKDGKLLVKKGVQSLLLKAVDYSPMK